MWGGYHLPSGCCGCVGTTRRGVYFSRKNGFLRAGALRRRTRCSLLHTALFRRSCMGVISLPSACVSCCRNAGRPRVTAAYLPFYAVPEFALCGLNIPAAGTHATPAPNRAHSGSHGETRGGFPARDIGRVDRVNSLGTLCIVTFDTAQLNEPLAVAAAHHGGNSGFA